MKLDRNMFILFMLMVAHLKKESARRSGGQIAILILLLIPLFAVACDTFEVRIECTPTPGDTTTTSTVTLVTTTILPTTQTPTPIPPTPIPPPTPVSPPTSTPTVTLEAIPRPVPTPTDTPISAQIFTFEVTPTQADPGDTVTLNWEASGDWAIICPSARFALFSSDDCQQVSPSGVTTFTIPLETAGSQFINFSLRVQAQDASDPQVWQVSVALKCHTTWFFSDEPQAGVCPTEPINSYAAAQRFERGTMIWLEQLGRYIILDETPLYEQDVRKKVYFVYDPLEIVRDTSAEVNPPEGFYAPESGFGLVWRGDASNSPGYRETLGWALAPEFGYEAAFQCDDALPSGGRSWQTCYLKGPDDEIIVFHPLGGWYLLDEPADPSAWLVYSNDERGIQLRYPPTFFFVEDEFANDATLWEWNVIFFDKQYQQEHPSQTPGIWIHAYPNLEGMSSDDWLARHSTSTPFGTEVDLEPPVHYLWPDELIQKVFVAGREGRSFTSDAMGLRIPLVLLPHEGWMLEIAFGDFGPDDLQPIFAAMLETLELRPTIEQSDGDLTCLAIPEVSIEMCFPQDYSLSRNAEANRRGSFVSYDFRPLDRYQTPCLKELQFFSEESIAEFALLELDTENRATEVSEMKDKRTWDYIFPAG